MKRVVVFLILAAFVFATVFWGMARNTDVTLINARAIPLDDQNKRFVVTFDIQNDGPAKTITNLKSASAEMVRVMNPGHESAQIVIPANSTGFFAMDGAHVMLMTPQAPFEPGASVPLTLEFAEYAEVTTRVLNVGGEMGMDGMDHDMTQGIQAETSPKITLSTADGFDETGADISVNVENFSFVRAADNAPHVPNQGHGHIYLNGLKIGRLYAPNFSLNALPAGSYNLIVTLNSNTHQPYVRGGSLVQDTLSFIIQ
ncbi:MAG: copper chaperone PCu(A)C [Roseobacter sp.]